MRPTASTIRRGIKFETFAERRIRGAMIDALRKDAWPRGVRRVRRELEAAREKLRASLGHEPSLADLAQEIGSDEKRLGKTIVRINTIESTSPFSSAENVDETQLPAVLVPAEPERPDLQYERDEVRERVRVAIATLPAARTARDRALLLQRSDDEGHWRGAGRQRIARLAAARAGDPPAARSARRRGHADRRVTSAAQRDCGVRASSRRWRRPRCPSRTRGWRTRAQRADWSGVDKGRGVHLRAALPPRASARRTSRRTSRIRTTCRGRRGASRRA